MNVIYRLGRRGRRGRTGEHAFHGLLCEALRVFELLYGDGAGRESLNGTSYDIAVDDGRAHIREP